MKGRFSLEKSGVVLLATRLSKLGQDPCGGSEVVLWEDAAILQNAGIPVRVYGRAASKAASVHLIPLRSRNPHFNTFEYGAQLLRREREATIIAYNEPALAGLAPDRTIVRYDWNTPLPRYWDWPWWLSRFQRARYLFPSESERQLFLDAHGRVPVRSTSVVPNAVDLNLFRPLDGPESIPTQNGLRVGFAGQWVPRKGITELMAAWRIVLSAVPSAKLYMAGGADLWKSSVETTGASGSADQVHRLRGQGLLDCVGALRRTQMPEFWNSVDVAVVPSLYEPFGLVALEAQACGVPVVTTTAGGLKEIVIDNETGLLVPPGDAAALARALITVLTNNDLRSRLASGARNRAQMFSMARRSSELLRIIDFREAKAA